MFGRTVEWYLRQNVQGIPGSGIFRVSDDWLLLASSFADCEILWQLAITTLEEFGLEVNRLPTKSNAPCQCIIWCGLEYDSVDMTVRLPAEKVAKALELVCHFFHSEWASRGELDSLFGYLSYCAHVVFGGRAFLHRLRTLRFRSDGTTRPSSWMYRIDENTRLDMAWWGENLLKVNGDRRIPIVALALDTPLREGFLDARGGDGGVRMFFEGAFVGLSGSQCNALYPAGAVITSPGAWATPSVVANHWEMFVFIVFIDLFGPCIANQSIRLRSDSVTAIRCVRDLTAALDSPELAALTRTFLSLCVDYNVRIVPEHIPGESNVLADTLSRARYGDFASHAHEWLAGANQHSTWLDSLSNV